MHKRTRTWACLVTASALAAACATGAEIGDDDANEPVGGELDASLDATADARPREAGTSSSSGTPDTLDASNDASNDAGNDASNDASNDAGAPPPPLVYAHSETVLYRYDGVTTTAVGAFTGVAGEQVIDLAVDKQGAAYLTTFSGLYRVNLQTAAATAVSAGSYPNSLSFVPAGTLDPTREALVGYSGATYQRIDPLSGAITTIGSLGGDYLSSGDVVSVAGGGTFLTVNGNGCGDCLVQINPVTGAIAHNYGDVGHDDVYGLAYWAGILYGFAGDGVAFTLTWQNGQLVSTPLLIANPPTAWYGAGSSTLAPVAGPGNPGPPLF